MSFGLMKERIKITGATPREEMILNGQNLLKEELQHDSSYSVTMYFYNPKTMENDRLAKIRIYNRKYSHSNGNFQNFLTTHDNSIKIGEYLHDIKENTYWIVCDSFNTNDIHYEGKMVQCNCILRWQNSYGKIIERWVFVEDFTKYSNGTTGNNTLTVGDNQYGVIIPIDEETKRLKRNMRFPIDFDDSEQPDVYRLTNRKTALNDYSLSGHGGTMIITMSINSYNKDKDKQIMLDNGKKVWICDYKEKSPDDIQKNNNITFVKAKILGEENIKLGFQRTYMVEFENDNGILDWKDVEFKWDITSHFDRDKITSQCINNAIQLYAEDEDLLDEKIKLSVIVNDRIITEKVLNIR